MTDSVLPECASCLNMRGPLSHLTSDFYFKIVNSSKHSFGLKILRQIIAAHSAPIMNNIHVLYFKQLLLLTVISLFEFAGEHRCCFDCRVTG